MEGAAYLAQLQDDPELEAQFDRIVEVIAAAQEPNGYLYPSHTTKVGTSKSMMGDEPYTFVVHSHELYNMGHLYEAAIAYYLATGKDKLLEVAEKNARHVNQVFFVGDPKYNDGKPIRQAPGHQEMELALVKMYKVTGKELYLEMAEKFLEIRGKTYVPDGEGVMSPTYAQQHAPLEKQKEAVGHAVRATYLYSAMADLAALTKSYTQALHRIWSNITDTRMHITGVLAQSGIEGFGLNSYCQCGCIQRNLRRRGQRSLQFPDVSRSQGRQVSGRCGSFSTQQRAGRGQSRRKQILLREPPRGRWEISLQSWNHGSGALVRNRMLPKQHLSYRLGMFKRVESLYCNVRRDLDGMDIGGSRLAISQTTEYPNKAESKFHSITKARLLQTISSYPHLGRRTIRSENSTDT